MGKAGDVLITATLTGITNSCTVPDATTREQRRLSSRWRIHMHLPTLHAFATSQHHEQRWAGEEVASWKAHHMRGEAVGCPKKQIKL